MKININDVTKKFSKKTVLNHIDLTIEDQEIFCLLGASGGGKTTLLRSIMGALPVNEGSITIEDIPVPNMELLHHIGFMPQQDALYHELSVLDNIKFFAGIQSVSKADQKKRIPELLDIVGLTGQEKVLVSNCSGGMKKRLSLAATLIHDPDLLVLDEPTVGIDPVLRRQIWDYLKKLKQNGTTILVTTHVMDEVTECDRAALLRDGSVLCCDTIEALLASTKEGKIEELFFQ